MSRISVLGAGAWGTALAQCYAAAGHDVTLWVRQDSLAQTIKIEGCNTAYLPSIKLHPNLDITSDITECLNADVILNVIPAQYLRENLRWVGPMLRDGQPVVLCAKGIEVRSHKLLSEVAAEECPKATIAILTGPNFASDIARGLPSASTLASHSASGKQFQTHLTARNLRLYSTDDMIGAQVGGAIKNVIAIACGISQGMGLGESARAALVTRGLAEIARLTTALGGERETLMGQCGVGDLILTCSSTTSRNFSLGVELAKGKSLGDILASRNSVTEGVATSKAAHELAEARHVDMPVTSAIYKCLHENLPLDKALDNLLDRPARHEKE